jgi:phage/plasmid-like protein (TIGR03299 family)
MAHNLFTNSDGKASMFYYGDVPWHKLGKRLDEPATAEEAIEAAGLDFDVELKPVKTTVKRKVKTVPKTYASIRSDTGDILGVVGSRYQPIQNREAFSFFDALVGSDEAMYHTAGVIGKGERIWILAKLPDYIKVGRQDIVDKYLLLSNSHDGSTVVRAKLTPIRVVCNNTLLVAMSGSEQEVRIRHTVNAAAKLEEAHKLLGLTNILYSQLDGIFNTMALKRVTDKQLIEYVRTLVPENPKAKYQTRNENIRTTILDLHESGEGAELSRGTAWGIYNAAVEYVDHVQNSRNPARQLKSIWFGSGEKFKLKAFRIAQDLMRN